MRNKSIWLALIIGIQLIAIEYAAAHCEIPCGIYDDRMRIQMALEHVATMEKSMNQILELEKSDQHNANQLTRWIMNKEAHAGALQEIVSQYFMTQRLKTDSPNYARQLAVLRQMLVEAMKVKQSTDSAHIKKLRELITEFQDLYFEKKQDAQPR